MAFTTYYNLINFAIISTRLADYNSRIKFNEKVTFGFLYHTKENECS